MSAVKINWEVIAHDYNSPLARNFLWTNSFFKYPKLCWVTKPPLLGVVSQRDHIEYIADMDSWTLAHEEIKVKVTKDYKYLLHLIDRAETWGKKLNRWTYQNIYSKDLKGLSSIRLISLLKKFIDMQEDQYVYGTVLPTLDFLDYSFIEGNLKKYLETIFPPVQYLKYYALFTEPVKLSFSQEQEISLLKIIIKFSSCKDWSINIRKFDYQQMIAKYPDFAVKLKAHTRKFAWVYYVYAGPSYKEEDFFQFLKDYVTAGINPQQKIKQWQDKVINNAVKKKELIKSLKPSQFEKAILNMAGLIVWSKPRRKDYQSKSYYHMEKLYREIGRRLYLSLSQVRSCPVELMEEYLKQGKADIREINSIYNFHVCVPKNNKTILLSGERGKNFYRHKVRQPFSQKLSFSNKQLTGSVAFPGQVSGQVKIINQPKDMVKMKVGDILVSTSTTPSIVPAMKKAAAIITDEGGLTCHAAIVSRELEIPCVVGLKVATQAFKDGDRVVVNADRGIIRKIISRSKSIDK